MHYYWAYGLSICSEIEFPELMLVEDGAASDVMILTGSPSFSHPSIDDAKLDSFFIDDQYAIIGIKHVAIYEILHGKQIIIHPQSTAIDADIRVYCLSNAFAALLYQRNILPLHTGAVIHQNALVLIMGASGSGKSTLLYRLMLGGYQVFSDDVVVLPISTQNLRVQSSYPLMKLWSHQMQEIGLPIGQPIRSGVDKFPYYFHQQFDTEPMAVVKIVLLKTCAELRSIASRKLTGTEALMEVMRNIYRKEWIPTQMLKAAASILSVFVQSAPCIEITRPLLCNCEEEVVGLFTSILGEENRFEQENPA
ncbi:MAG: hypothetical protein ACO23W_06025 [Chitinophagaceae bacterium]|jgi:hypothetical protein